MIEAETETAEIPIKKTAQVVLAMGSTSRVRCLRILCPLMLVINSISND